MKNNKLLIYNKGVKPGHYVGSIHFYIKQENVFKTIKSLKKQGYINVYVKNPITGIELKAY